MTSRLPRPSLLLAPRRVAHAWFEGDAGASGGTATATPPAPATGTPPPAGGTAPAGDGGSGASDGGIGEPPLSLDEAQKLINELRKEQAKTRTRLKAYEEAEDTAKKAAMSETEKLQARIRELEQAQTAATEREKRTALRVAVVTQAAKAGFADPEDAMRMLDADAVEWTEDGSRPKNVESLLNAILRSKPYLKSTTQLPPDMGQGNRGTGGLTLADVKRMTPEQIIARQAEVDEALRRGV